MGTVIFGAGKAGQYLLNEMAVHRGGNELRRCGFG